jgi:hypothetical protein
MITKRGVCIVSCLLGLLSASASDVVEVESRVLGDGWFEYRVRKSQPAFVGTLTFLQLAPWFTNYVTATPPEYWTNAFYNNQWSGIRFDGSVVQPRINEKVFQVKSSSPAFRQQTYGFTTILSLTTADPNVIPGGAGGYITLGALLPCAPELADGSPSNLVTRVHIVSDIIIDELIVTNGGIHGVKFTWPYKSTIRLEGSHDMDTWTPVARFFGWPGQTTWTTNTALNSYGQFFRLAMISSYHMTNAARILTHPSATEIPLEKQELANGQIRVTFASVPQGSYEVQHTEWSGLVKDSRQVTADGTSTTVAFDLVPGQSSGAFRVWKLAQ